MKGANNLYTKLFKWRDVKGREREKEGERREKHKKGITYRGMVTKNKSREAKKDNFSLVWEAGVYIFLQKYGKISSWGNKND